MEVFVGRQASERAYIIFKTSAEERAEALKVAGDLIFGKQKFPGPDILKTEHDRMVATQSLLHAANFLGNSLNPTRDHQISGRACGYRLLLSPVATDLYPFMTKQDGFRAAELSMLLNLEISSLGPRGPLEEEGAGSEEEFLQWSEKRQKFVCDWEYKLMKEISQLIGTGKKIDKSRVLDEAGASFKDSLNSKATDVLRLLQKQHLALHS